MNERITKLEKAKTETKTKADPKSDAKEGDEGKPSVPSSDVLAVYTKKDIEDVFTDALASLTGTDMKATVEHLDKQIKERKIEDKTGLYSHYGIIARNTINDMADKLKLWK